MDPGHAQRMAEFVAVEPGGVFQVAQAAVGEARAVDVLVLGAAAGEQRTVGLADLVAVVQIDAAEEVLEVALVGLVGQPVERRGARRAVQRVARDVPVPGAQCGRFQGQVQALLADLQCLFLLALAGDVAHRQHQAALALEFDLAAVEQVDAALAVAVVEVGLEVAEVVVFQCFEHAQPLAAVAPDVQLHRGAPDGFGLAPAELPLETGVDLDETAAEQVGDHHGIGAAEEGVGELALAGAQGGFGALAFAGV